MNGDKTPRGAKVVPMRGRGAKCAVDIRAAEIGQQILENEKMVQLIIDSAKTMSPAMTVDEFKLWLDRLGNENGPSGDGTGRSH